MEVLVRVTRPEGPPCVPKVSLDCTILFLGTFRAFEEPYYVLEIFLSFRKLVALVGGLDSEGPFFVPQMSLGCPKLPIGSLQGSN